MALANPLFELLNRELDAVGGSLITWPNKRAWTDFVWFCRDILGVEPWEKQIEIQRAMREHGRVAVTSGHKTSKSHTASCLSLSFYCGLADSRFVLTAPTSRQVDEIIWRELKIRVARSGRCVECKAADPAGPTPCPHSSVIPETPFELARSGLKSQDFRQIYGFTAKEKEAVAGISGSNLGFCVDESTGVGDEIHEAIEGNRAGGAIVLHLSNPTRNDGEFAAAFGPKKHLYYTIHVSSEETPNCKTGYKLIPGLATREWVEEKRREWGDDSPLYKVRVKGEFVSEDEGKIISVALIAASTDRWAETEAEGRLVLACDPAGVTGEGDESTFSARRGNKILELYARRGLDEGAILIELVGLARRYREPHEVPIVVIDREGAIGAKVWGLISSYSVEHPRAFAAYGVRSSELAKRQPSIYGRTRDELWANLRAWMVAGGALPEDSKLEAELNCPEWGVNDRGYARATPKEEMRKKLGRSPDRADCICLVVWPEESLLTAEPSIHEAAPTVEEKPAKIVTTDQDLQGYEPGEALDPYAGVDAWSR